MGISIQSYRIRIGTFANTKSSYKCNVYKDNSHIKRSVPKASASLITKILLLLVSTTLLATPLFSSSATKLYNYKNFSCSILSERQMLISQNKTETINVNFEAHYKFGNRKKNGIKILHWNAGARHLKNKINDIENVISSYRPAILGISEGNFKKEHNLEDVQIENYSLYFSETLNNPDLNISRVVVYVHNDIAVKLRKDLMNDSFSSIWLEINLPRKKKFLVCQCYREWQYMGQDDDSSHSIEAQFSRWDGFLKQWEKALNTDLECHTLGDMNLNFLQ